MAEGPAGLDHFIERSLAAAMAASGNAPTASTSRPARSAPLDIAIPVYNNAAELRECLDSLLATLSPADRVWLSDDASTEAEVSEIIQDFAEQWQDTRLLQNPENLGFVGNANRLIAETDRDLVLLNSDTVAMPGWLEHLQAALNHDAMTGIVCPLSDAATILSVIPGSAKPHLLDRVEKTSCANVLLPTAVGFCMLLRRQLLQEIGSFSEVFSPGYGEENDLSLRALRAGWNIIAADRACVLHRSGGSFGSNRSRELQQSHGAKLDKLWPEYGPLVRSWWRTNPLRNRAEQLAAPDQEQASVVHVLHRQYRVGGTERVTRDLVSHLQTGFNQILLYPGESDNAWCDFELRGMDTCRELMLNRRWIRASTRIGGHAADLTCAHSEQALARVIKGSGAKCVHFHHLLHWDSLMLPLMASALGCRVIISVHDFWFNCPIHNQLEHETGQICGRDKLMDDDRCSRCLNGYGSTANDHAAYANARAKLVHRVLQAADAVCVPSPFIRDKILRAYGDDLDGKLRILPHGVAIAGKNGARKPRVQSPGERRIIAYYGGDQVLKGAGLVLQMARALSKEAVTFRIHGRIKAFDHDSLPDNIELHGFYNPDQLESVMTDVDLALIPSFYEESFSMVASECWAHGVPVLASNRGALADRVQPGINGWTVADMRAESWIQQLHEVLAGDTLKTCTEQLRKQSVITVAQSAAHYRRLYLQLIESAPHGTGELPPIGTEPQAPARFLTQVEALRDGVKRIDPMSSRCLGIHRDNWGTANYRLRFPLQDLAQANKCDRVVFHSIQESGFSIENLLSSGEFRHVVVQPFLSNEGLSMMEWLHRYPGLRVTLVIDDLWTGLMKDNPARSKMPDDIEGRLRYASELSHSLVLTTPTLSDTLPVTHPNTHVINNGLPTEPWLSLAQSLQRHGTSPKGKLRIGWVGAPQHHTDLEFLQPVIEATCDEADWVFQGMCPDHIRPLAAEVHGMVPFDDYPEQLASLDLDLAIAPLSDTPFNRCKSHLKVLECGILGIPVIASDLETYRHCPVPLVPPDSVEHWSSAIRRMLRDNSLRKQEGNALQRWVMQNHLLKHRRNDWLNALGISYDPD